jgi:hypothetical protein
MNKTKGRKYNEPHPFMLCLIMISAIKNFIVSCTSIYGYEYKLL